MEHIVMFIFVNLVLSDQVTDKSSDEIESEELYLMPELTDEQKDNYRGTINLNASYFDKLLNYHINANIVSEAKYPWIGRIVNSKVNREPFMCTTACIRERLFITAARCLAGLTLQYTRVIYMYTWIPPIAFIMPYNESKQQFDDIGVIVVNNDYAGKYYTKNISHIGRNGKDFTWLPSLLGYQVKVIGFATLKGHYNLKNNANYNLTEVDVLVNLEYCTQVLTLINKFGGFAVPCYVPCGPTEFLAGEDPRCDAYLGAEGGIVLSVKNDYIIGVATWGVQANKLWAVGFAPVNGDNFLRNYYCGIYLIQNSSKINDYPGSFQKACDGLEFIPYNSNKSLNLQTYM